MADEAYRMNHDAEDIDAALDMLLNTYTREEIDAKLDERAPRSVLGSAALALSTLGGTRKNLLKVQFTSSTVNGVTFTLNSDGSVTVTGTATADATKLIASSASIAITPGDYIISGCPEGGSAATYRLRFWDGAKGNDDFGGGGRFTFSGSTGSNVSIIVKSGVTIDETFYPMIRQADISDSTWEPYRPSVEERLTALETALNA